MEKYFYFDRSKSIEELESDFWEDHIFETEMISKLHSLRKIPLQELSLSNIRLLISQSIGLEYVIPLAIEELSENIFVDSEFYFGDLLNQLIEIENDFWSVNEMLKEDLKAIILSSMSILEKAIIRLNT